MFISLKTQRMVSNKVEASMVRHASLFSQLVAFFHRSCFHSLAVKHKAEKYSRGFNSWDHFIAMLFCQLAQAKSLREICGGLSCCMGKLRHLGVNKAPNKLATNRLKPEEYFEG